MQRIELTGDHHSFNGLLGSAYVDPESNQVVMVYINLSSAAQKVTWTFKGGALSSDELVPYVTSASDDLAEKPPISAAQGTEIPSQSIVTLTNGRETSSANAL